MITSIAHATIYVLNQDEALDFYKNKLGFEVGDDMKVEGGFRWLTVYPKSKPQLQLVLAEPKEGPMFTKDSAEKIRSLIKEGALERAFSKLKIAKKPTKSWWLKEWNLSSHLQNSFMASKLWP